MPCRLPSNSETWVTRTFAGNVVAGIDGEAMVLAGDQHLAGVEVLHRMVGAVVAELHLHGLAAGSQAHQLVAEADAEHRDAASPGSRGSRRSRNRRARDRPGRWRGTRRRDSAPASSAAGVLRRHHGERGSREASMRRMLRLTPKS
jgi:hypothetical protein